MNVRLKYNTEFTAGIIWEGHLSMNNYRVALSFSTISSSGEDHNIALDRVKFFIHNQLTHSVFVSEEYQEQCQKLIDAGARITTLPEEPVDQVIGIMLYSKLNAIMEDRMAVTQIEIASDLGDHIWYLHDSEEPLGPFDSSGWWNKSDPDHYDPGLIGTNKIVSMSTSLSWGSINLAWIDDRPTAPIDDEKVVFADFQKDETK